MVQTTCPYCGVGCGVVVEEERIAGDERHPANFGRLCSKGAALAETFRLTHRILFPLFRGQPISWSEAISRIAAKFKEILSRSGPEAIYFYLSGQLLTEDYYVANKLVKGFLGTAQVDTNSRLCMASPVVAHKRAFGEDLVPICYEDLEEAELVVLVGSNLAWCHPVLFRRLREAARRPKLVAIDPRRTFTASAADLHLPLKPGTDANLFCGLLVYLYDRGLVDWPFVENHTEGLSEALEAARRAAPDLETVARRCELEPALVKQFYRTFAERERVITAYSQGINQSTSGVDKINAILNVHLLTGRIGKPGCGPFSVTGQPNAMGGREVGAMANQLAAHMELEDPDMRERVRRFWRSPTIASRPGLKATEITEALEKGEIRAIWIMATNPAVSLPDGDRFREALKRCELVIVSDCVATATTALADIVLPAATWGEKSGTVTNSVRVISRQRPFRKAPGQARPDWWMVCQVARALGFEEPFAYRTPAEIFREHAALSALNRGERLFDLSALAEIDESRYQKLEPRPWPITPEAPQGTKRLFCDLRFPTPSGRARFVPITPRPPARRPDASRPLILNTGRVRDQWHTMSRTGSAPRLTGHAPEPFVEVHPEDAERLGLTAGGLARLRGHRHRELLVRVVVTERQRPGSLFVPMHWNDLFTGAGRVNALLENLTDPLSGQPEFKHQPVTLAPFPCRWSGFLLSRRELPEPKPVPYWSRWQIAPGIWCYQLAGFEEPSWPEWVRELLGGRGDRWLELHDRLRHRYRGAVLEGERLFACFAFGCNWNPWPPAPLLELLLRPRLNREEREALLSFGLEEGSDRTVCACFQISEKRLRQAVASGADTVEKLGELLGAGRKCRSCLPELEAVVEGGDRATP